jgi:hypothetical protein
MKYLTDKEILNWNKRLEKSGYMVYPSMNTRSSEPDISYRQIIKNGLGMGDTFAETTEPFIRYKFIFSVSSNRVEFFSELFSKLTQDPFGTKSIYKGQNQDKITSIEVNEKIIDSKSEVKHKILDKEYVKFTYEFAGKLGSIMGYVSYLEDAINIFSMIWGYQEDGSEVCLLKFPIGTIVSPKSDKSKDLLILDYKFVKIYDKYYIDYYATEMLNQGSVIKYGISEEYKEDLLCFSRNNRIDNILN